MESFFKLMGEEQKIQLAKVRLAKNGKISLYAELLVYNEETRKYDVEVITMIADYKWHGNKVALDFGEDNDDMAMHLLAIDNYTFELRYGNEQIKDLFFTSTGDGFIFYENGIALTSSSDSLMGALEYCFWKYLDDDTIMITTILGIGLIYDNIDGTLYLNEDYVNDKNVFEDPEKISFLDLGSIGNTMEIYKYKDSDDALIFISTGGSGNGEGNENGINGYFMLANHLSDEVYYTSVIFIDILIYNIDGQIIVPPFDS
jgi:hypothetical protein